MEKETCIVWGKLGLLIGLFHGMKNAGVAHNIIGLFN